MKRLSLLGLAALAVLAVALVACSSSSDTPAEPTSVANEGEGDGVGVAAVCVEGTVDCQDTVVLGDDAEGLPGVCADDPNAPGCLAEEPPIDPALPPGSIAYRVTVDFDETYTDASTDSVLAVLQSADPNAEVVIQERFPPAAVATINSSDGEFCAVTTERLMDVAGVGKVTCDLAVDVGAHDPDAPVTSP